VRRAERQLISWYRQTITQVLAHLDDRNHALAVVIANAPEAIRGYEEIKLRRLAETQELVAQHLARFTASVQREELATLR
jgi:indolepyruvate ferredoxin oxidoreductase